MILTQLGFFHFCSSVWRLWRSRLQQYQDLYTLQDQVLNQRALTLQSRVKIHKWYIVNICVLIIDLWSFVCCVVLFFRLGSSGKKCTQLPVARERKKPKRHFSSRTYWKEKLYIAGKVMCLVSKPRKIPKVIQIYLCLYLNTPLVLPVLRVQT